MITADQKQHFDQRGYLILKNLFSKAEVEQLTGHYMDLRLQGSHPGDSYSIDPNSSDPLKVYPRMLMMHRWDETSLKWLLDQRIASSLAGLLDQPAFAVQTMIYFKPPKARGQALHQDQYFLRVQPGTCIAAWMALDPCDEQNGCLKVVAGSQDWPLLCTIKADATQSFTDITVPIPEGSEVVPMIMEPGDVLFFNGQVVHGSGPNTSEDRFRRSLIGHYIAGDAREVWKWYHPILRMDGSEVGLEVSDSGGACGTWVDQDGEPVVELTGFEDLSPRTE